MTEKDDKEKGYIIDFSEVRDGIEPLEGQTKCPHCGSELEFGFGLAGGGYGTYVYCEEHGIIAKDNEDGE